MGCLIGCCLALLAVVAPPIPVLFRRGVGSSLLLCCLLCVLGWIPGVFYAWYVIARSPDRSLTGDRGRGREPRVVEEGRYATANAPPAAGYGASPAPPPPAAQGLYYPPPPQQETGRVRH
ncbi:hypothetical protein AAFC00_003379 [Neodothiora populina]|uniref:Uncharacterized protein n=1 Tax=Neodothiora populina TaxID=2781224 RepID=A0ABR3PE12_9PEZI